MIWWINGSDVAFSDSCLVFVFFTNYLWLVTPTCHAESETFFCARSRLESSLLFSPDEEKIFVSLFNQSFISLFYYGNERKLLCYWEQALLTTGTGLNLDWKISLALLLTHNTHNTHTHSHTQFLSILSGNARVFQVQFWLTLFLTSVFTSDFYLGVRLEVSVLLKHGPGLKWTA